VLVGLIQGDHLVSSAGDPACPSISDPCARPRSKHCLSKPPSGPPEGMSSIKTLAYDVRSFTVTAQPSVRVPNRLGRSGPGKVLAYRYVPADTGRLRASLHTEKPGDGFAAGTDVEYGIYQELGTRRMRAQPYLRPALDEVLRGV
jgi:hypothetical protein